MIWNTYITTVLSSTRNLKKHYIQESMVFLSLQNWAYYHTSFGSHHCWVHGLPVWETRASYPDRHELLCWGLERSMLHLVMYGSKYCGFVMSYDLKLHSWGDDVTGTPGKIIGLIWQQWSHSIFDYLCIHLAYSENHTKQVRIYNYNYILYTFDFYAYTCKGMWTAMHLLTKSVKELCALSYIHVAISD